jgi:3-isopropylmalate/(R)-2-methylmalate dehydratase large subunit
MGQTMVEKLFSRHNLQGTPVKAGDFLDARIDGAMCHYQFMDIHKLAVDAGFKDGFPRIWDLDRFFLLIDHHQPALSQSYADENVRMRREAARLGVRHFHDAEPGIAHQMMTDYGYVRPGELVVGNDSHTIAYGALNAGSSGITRADMMYALLFGELWFQVPETIKIVLNGRAPKYPIAKDIILYLAGKYGDDFAQNMSLEFTGSLAPDLDIDGRLCLSTHGVEVAAKFAFFPFDEKTKAYVETRTDKPYSPLTADPDASYAREIVVNVDEMPFVVAKPHQFGNVHPIAEARGVKIDQAQIGSCSNGRFEDIEIAARMLRGRQVARGVRFIISPASQQVYLQCLKAGLIEQLIESGVQVVTPGCGICQPKVGYLSDGEVCITATTRNFRGRKGSLDSEIYLAGPLSVAAAAVAGKIVDPREVFDEL